MRNYDGILFKMVFEITMDEAVMLTAALEEYLHDKKNFGDPEEPCHHGDLKSIESLFEKTETAFKQAAEIVDGKLPPANSATWTQPNGDKKTVYLDSDAATESDRFFP